MRKSGILFIAVLGAYVQPALAQDINEAYNLSNTTVQGTARSMGFGNTLGSIGGDFSSISVNPAGLGVYRSSELTFTPGLSLNSSSSQYLGSTTTDNNTNFVVSNFGMVLTSAPHGHRYDRRNWKSVSFAFGMNRNDDFDRTYMYSGTNNTSSGSQVFESDANKYPSAVTDPNSYSYGSMGANAGLLSQNANGQYSSIVPFSGGVNQTKSVNESGSQDEYTFALGGNYREKLLLGISFGFDVFDYHDQYYYQEGVAAGNTAANPYNFNYFNYAQTEHITGGGVNSTIGAIYKLGDMFRIGASLHTPTYYSISDHANPVLTTQRSDSTFSTGNGNYASRFDYNFTTPWKGVLSASMIIKNFGFITADYEYVDYSTMRYIYPGGVDYYGNSYQEDQDNINQQIKQTYKATSNFRVGAEFKLTQYFMVRGGIGYYGNAYTPYGEANSSFYNTERIDLSAGVGFHFHHFFTDLALVHSDYTAYSSPYTVDYTTVVSGASVSAPQAKIDYSINNVALTVGVKF